MANKETRIIKSNTLEELRQKTNEVSLHLGDNEQLNASLTDKTFDFANVSAGNTLFDANDNNSKTVEFNIKSEETLDNTGGYIILKGSPSLTGFVANATVTQTGGYSATIVSASTDKILVKNSSGTFDSTKNLTVGSNNIPNANVIRIIAEAYNVGVVRVYINNAEISQNLLAGGFHVANSSSTIPLLNTPSITDFNEGATIYQGGALGTATFSATVLSATSTQLRLKNHTGSFSQSTLIKVDGSAATITGANHGDLSNRDITIGNVIELNTPAAANDDIKIFSSSIVDAVNELQDDVGIIENLEASLGTDVVTALNNIESIFDASAYGISAGVNAFDITSGTLTLDSSGDINLDADGDSVHLKAGPSGQFGEFERTGTNLIIKSGNSTMLTGSGSNATFANDLTITSDLQVAVNLNVDGITTLDGTTVDGTFNVTGATDLDTTLNVDGATTLIGQLNTRSNNFLGNGTGDNTTVSGNLNVGVNSTLTGNLTVNGTEAEINANLDVNGNADVSGTTDLHGVVEINNTLGVDGNFRVGSSNNNYFNVTAASGNTQIDGNLEVDGTIGVDGNFRVGGTNYTDATFKVDESNGNTVIAGTTAITGNLTVGSLGTAAQNVKDSLNELHTQVGTVLFPGPSGLDNTTTLSLLDPTNLTTALVALDHEIGDTDSYNDGTYGAATIAGTLDLLQAGMIANDTNITDLFADVGSLSLSSGLGSDLTSAVNSLSTQVGANDSDISNLATTIDGNSTVPSSVSLTGLAATNIKGALNELAAEKLDINTGGTSGSIGRINAGTDSIQSIVSRLNLTGNVTFVNGGNNANTMTFNTGTTLDMSNASLLLPGNASNVNIFSTSFLEVDGNVETPMGFGVDRQHVTLADKADVKIQWHENYADGTSQTRPARAWQLVGLTDSGSSNTADIVTYYNAKELIGSNTESGINVTWDSTAQNFDFNVNDPTITLGTGPISGNFTITNLGNATFNTTLDNNSVTLGTHTVGNYVDDVNGTQYQITSTHIQSEGSTATLSIPTDFRMPGTAKVLSTTNSTSKTTGALTVAGGVGINDDLYVGGDLVVQGDTVTLNTSTLTVEDTLVLAGNSLGSEPSSGGFGLEVGPITSPSGLAAGVTGAHSIVYNYGTDQWEADGSLILSNATNTPPTIESNAFGAGKNLDFVNGTGISIVTTTSGNDIDVQITNTLDGYSGWFLSTQGADKGNIADDERVDFFGGTALTAVHSVVSGAIPNRVTFNHNNITTTTSAAVDDGTYIKGLTINAQGHVTNIDSGDFDDYYNNYVLPVATSSALGGIKIGYTESGKNYPVELSTQKAYVNVPWTDTTFAISCVDGAAGTEEKIRLTASSGGTDDVVLASSTGLSIARDGDKITYTNSAPNVTTNLSKTVSGDGFSINSSDGNNVALTLADTNNWGIMSDEMFDKLDGIATGATATNQNTITNITVTQSNDTVTVQSSDGGDATIAVSNSTDGSNGAAGVMSRAQSGKLHNIAANATATNENTVTNLSTTTSTTSVTVNSSDGTNATISEATTTAAGVMTVAHHNKLDGIATGATNTSAPFYTSAVPAAIPTGTAGAASGLITATSQAKLNGIASGATNTVGNATHTGDVTGSAGLTIAANVVSNTKLADMAANTIKGRITSAGDPQDLSAANIRTIVNVEDGSTADQDCFKTIKIYSPGPTLQGNAIADSTQDIFSMFSGTGISMSTSGDNVTITNTAPNVNYSLPLASSSTRGGVKVGYAESGKNYPVELSSEKMYVNVPWTDTNTTYSRASFINQACDTTSTVQFAVVRSSGDIVAYYSDDRLKNRIGNIESALDKVNQLNGFTFTPNEESVRLGLDPEGKVRVGVSAQEVEAVLPEAVTDAPVENDQGYKTVQYEKMIPLLIEAIKELTEQNKELKSEVEILKSINSR